MDLDPGIVLGQGNSKYKACNAAATNAISVSTRFVEDDGAYTMARYSLLPDISVRVKEKAAEDS